MKAPVFPVFVLKTYNNRVIYGGGGGDISFGRKNGIAVLDETTCKDIAYLETDDMILDICIYNYDNLTLEEDTLFWTDHSSENKEVNAQDDSVNDVIVKTENKTLNASEPVDSEITVFYMTCIGETYFYIVKFENDKLSFVTRRKMSVSSQIFCNHLFVISNKNLYTFPDILQFPKRLNYVRKGSSCNSNQEEYVYNLSKLKDQILVKREDGNTDIDDNWENMFIHDNKICKVVKEGDKYVFVYNQQKYSYDLEIRSIQCTKNGQLVFWIKGPDSWLVFISDSVVTHKVRKITCLDVGDMYVTVGTGDGYGIIYRDTREVIRKKLCSLPITGISYMNGFLYFSSYNGLVNRRKICASRMYYIYIVSALIVLLAYMYNCLYKK